MKMRPPKADPSALIFGLSKKCCDSLFYNEVNCTQQQLNVLKNENYLYSLVSVLELTDSVLELPKW